MSVIFSIDNKLSIVGGNAKINAAIHKQLTIDNPEYLARKKQKLSVYKVPSKLYLGKYTFKGSAENYITGRGFFRQALKMYKDAGISPEIIDATSYGDPADYKWSSDITLHDYQLDAISKSTKLNGVLVAPTGSGKTIMGMALIHIIRRKTLWIVHTRDLQVQAAERATMCLPGISIGYMGGGSNDYEEQDLIIATVQTLSRENNSDMIEFINRHIGLVIVDECHHTPASTFSSLISKFNISRVIGLTATPERKDNLESIMYNVIGPITHEIHRSEADGKLLVPELHFIYTDFKHNSAVSVSDTGSLDMGGDGGAYHEILKAVYADEDRIQLIARNICDRSATATGPSLILAESIEYLYKIKNAVHVLRPDLIQEIITGSHSKDHRARAIACAADNSLDIVYATQLAREGLDIQCLSDLHLITSKKGDSSGNSRDGVSIEQEVGRVIREDRNNPNKVARVFDYVDFHVDIFKRHYYSRRRVYKRLGIDVPVKRPNIGNMDHLFKW